MQKADTRWTDKGIQTTGTFLTLSYVIFTQHCPRNREFEFDVLPSSSVELLLLGLLVSSSQVLITELGFVEWKALAKVKVLPGGHFTLRAL